MGSMTLVLAPVTGATETGRPKWVWVVERTIGDAKHEIKSESRAAATKVFRDAILQGIQESFSVHARAVEPTGAGEEVHYDSSGRIVKRRMIQPREGLLGPRCFISPVLGEDRKARTASLRPPKKAAAPKPSAKPRTPKPTAAPKPAVAPKPSAKPEAKPRTPRTPKPAAAPKPAAISPHVAEYLALTSAAAQTAWATTAKPYQIAQVVKYVSIHGTAAQKKDLEGARAEARALLEARKPPKGKPGRPRKPQAPPPPKPEPEMIRAPRPQQIRQQRPARVPRPAEDPVFVPVYEPAPPVLSPSPAAPPVVVAPPPAPTPAPADDERARAAAEFERMMKMLASVS